MRATTPPAQVVVLGGGFGGVYTALALERLIAKGAPLEVSLVNRENYLVFQPMLAEVISGDVGILDTVSPLRQLLSRTNIFVREIEAVDFEQRVVRLAPGLMPRAEELAFDHLVIALGNTTDFRHAAGLAEHALAFKTLADAIRIRNHVIGLLEQAAAVREPDRRRQMLTFVVAGGGFSGTEAAAALNDFVRRTVRHYGSIPPGEVRVVLVHSGRRVLERELTPALASYATVALAEAGVELMLERRLVAASPHAAVLSSGERIATGTLISTVPSSPNPVVEGLGLASVRGRIECDETLAVKGTHSVWAVGDCAHIPTLAGQPCPPTAQHAIRQAKLVAANILAVRRGKRGRPFTFTGLGKLGGLGRRRAVAELPFGVQVAGLPAWLLWRGVYWSKLPGASRKTRVGISWLSDLLLPPHPVQLNLGGARGPSRAHYQPGEVIFEQGDTGKSLFMILSGRVEILKLPRDGAQDQAVVLNTLEQGEYFGELALLGRSPRSATARALSPVELLVLPAADFSALTDSLTGFREQFERVADRRTQADRDREQDHTKGAEYEY